MSIEEDWRPPEWVNPHDTEKDREREKHWGRARDYEDGASAIVMPAYAKGEADGVVRGQKDLAKEVVDFVENHSYYHEPAGPEQTIEEWLRVKGLL